MPKNLQTIPDAELIEIAKKCFNAIDANLADYPGVTQAQVDDIKTFYQVF